MKRDAKEALMEAATRLISRPGVQPEQVTVREIAGEAGVGAALINYHFGSKEALISACIQKMLGELIQAPGGSRPAPGETPRDKLFRMACATCDYLARRPNLGRIAILDDLDRGSYTDDTTNVNMAVFYPVVREACPEETETRARWKTHLLVHGIQCAFLRQESVQARMELDFARKEDRRAMVAAMMDILFPQPEQCEGGTPT